jgi:DNA-binding response OmpR family regulator
MKILLAEDEPSISTIITLALEKLGGHSVVLTENGADALTAFHKDRFDLVLLDSMMPKKDGVTVCKEIKNSNRPDVPVIFLSAKSQERDIRQGLECGAIGYIVKPFDPKTICSQIEGILAGKAQEIS